MENYSPREPHSPLSLFLMGSTPQPEHHQLFHPFCVLTVTKSRKIAGGRGGSGFHCFSWTVAHGTGCLPLPTLRYEAAACTACKQPPAALGSLSSVSSMGEVVGWEQSCGESPRHQTSNSFLSQTPLTHTGQFSSLGRDCPKAAAWLPIRALPLAAQHPWVLSLWQQACSSLGWQEHGMLQACQVTQG